MKNYDLIIFDCDGTLADSEYLNCLSCSNVLMGLGFERYTYDVVYTELVGVTLKDISKIVGKEYNRTLPDDFIDRVVRKVEENAPEYLKEVPGVSKAVKWSDEHFKICVASNGEPENVKNSVTVLGLADMLPDESIFTQAMVEHGKPAPDLFLLAAEKMGAAPSRTLVVEDTKVGVRAAKAAGMKVIGFTKMHDEDADYADKLREVGADHIMSDWSEFYDLVSA